MIWIALQNCHGACFSGVGRGLLVKLKCVWSMMVLMDAARCSLLLLDPSEALVVAGHVARRSAVFVVNDLGSG